MGFKFNPNVEWTINYLHDLNHESTSYTEGEFHKYKDRYNLSTNIVFIYDYWNNDFAGEFCMESNKITINKALSKELMIKVMLHETGHAIQFHKNKLNPNFKNINYLWNIECAAEKFSFKEYQRNYRHLGKFFKVKGDSYGYYRNFVNNFNNKKATDKLLNNLNKKYDFISSKVS